MQIWFKIVTRAWAKVVTKLAGPDAVNLWQVGSRHRWHGPDPGDLVLFLAEGSTRDILGYGRFVATTCHSPQDTWFLFGFTNGAWSLDGLLVQVAARCGATDLTRVTLANALLADPVFFPPLNPFELPDAFPTHGHAGLLCSAWSRRGRILVRSLRHHAGRSLVFGDSPRMRLLGYRTYRVPGTVVRVDDRTMRSILLETSGHRCAVSGEPIRATVDVAHPWPLEFGGPDDLGNRLALDVRPHRLWDNGLIGADASYRIMVSEQLRLWEPRSLLLDRAGQPLRRRTFGDPYPDAANLRWHRENLFRWPAYTP